VYFAGLFIGQGLKIRFLAIWGSVCFVLSFCISLFEINKLRVSLIIYCIIFLIGQIIILTLVINFIY